MSTKTSTPQETVNVTKAIKALISPDIAILQQDVNKIGERLEEVSGSIVESAKHLADTTQDLKKDISKFYPEFDVLQATVNMLGETIGSVSSVQETNIKALATQLDSSTAILTDVQFNQNVFNESLENLIKLHESTSKMLSDFYKEQALTTSKILEVIGELHMTSPLKQMKVQLKDTRGVRDQLLKMLVKKK